jgi:hypothetical protein
MPLRGGVLVALAAMVSFTEAVAIASRGSDATTVEIAPGVRMPFVSDGIILDAKANHTGEVKGLDLFFKLGGRGVDTAWSCQSHLLAAWIPPLSLCLGPSCWAVGNSYLPVLMWCRQTTISRRLGWPFAKPASSVMKSF